MATLHRADRNSLLAKIHIRKRELGLVDPEYRGLLRAWFGVDSSADLTMPQMAMLLGHMEDLAWVASSPCGEQKKRVAVRWALSGRNRRSLDSMVRSLFGISRLEWLADERDVRFIMRRIGGYENQADR